MHVGSTWTRRLCGEFGLDKKEHGTHTCTIPANNVNIPLVNYSFQKEWVTSYSLSSRFSFRSPLRKENSLWLFLSLFLAFFVWIFLQLWHLWRSEFKYIRFMTLNIRFIHIYICIYPSSGGVSSELSAVHLLLLGSNGYHSIYFNGRRTKRKDEKKNKKKKSLWYIMEDRKGVKKFLALNLSTKYNYIVAIIKESIRKTKKEISLC